MRRVAFLLMIFIFLFLGSTEAAYANQPPAPQTVLAEIMIAPITLTLFILSGAAALYDRTQKTRGMGSNRILILLVATVASLFSGMHEGFGALCCLVLGVWAVGIAITMIRLSLDSAAGAYTRWASRISAVVLIPTVVFLASFGFVYVGDYYYQTMGGEWRHQRTLQKFFDYQQAYSLQHEGQYHRLLPEDFADNPDQDLGEAFMDSGVWSLAREGKGNVNQVSVRYDPDLRSYEVKITPVSFFSWPYNLFVRRKAYYLDESGVIRCELLTGPGREASDSSPVLPGS